MKLVAGNWKMNGSAKKAERLAEALVERHRAGRIKPAVLLCPPAHLLQRVCSVIAGSGLQLGAQDCSDEAGPGAFTGEISASQLIDVDCNYVIVGHSERRQRHGETNEVVAAKAAQALAVGLIPIVCVGESLAEREAGEAARVVRRQVRESLPPSADTLLVVIAYEPVWAIGTGRTARPEDVEAMHAAIVEEFGERPRTAPKIPVIYGGSVKPENAGELMATPGVDGALVGGASLDAESFWAIVEACNR